MSTTLIEKNGFNDMSTFPVTYSVILLCVITWLLITYQGWSYDIVGCNYDRVVIYKETWRWITSTLSHVSFLHLVLNMYSLWNMRWMEQAFTSFVYFMWSILIAFLSTFVTLCIYYLQLLFFQREQVRYIYMVGYSAVLFGLLVIASQHMKVSNVVLFGIFEIPPSWLPFVSMGLVTLLVPEASVVGHSSGIFLGFLIDWNDDYLVQSPWCWIWLLGIATITTIAFAFRTTPTFISF